MKTNTARKIASKSAVLFFLAPLLTVCAMTGCSGGGGGNTTQIYGATLVNGTGMPPLERLYGGLRWKYDLRRRNSRCEWPI